MNEGKNIKNIADLIEAFPNYRGMTPAKLVDGIFRKYGYKDLFKIRTDSEQSESEFKGYPAAKRALVDSLRNGSPACLIGPPGTGKTYMTQILGKSLLLSYDSGELGYRWEIENCPVREDAHKVILLKKLLEAEKGKTMNALYSTMCPKCRKDIEKTFGRRVADAKKEEAVKLNDIAVGKSEFRTIDFDFNTITDAEQAKYELLYRTNLDKGLSGASAEESITMGLCADNFTFLILNELHRPINEYGQEVMDPLFKMLEKSKGREISTPAGTYPVDVSLVFNMNGGVNADLALLRRIGLNFIPVNYPKIETEKNIIREGISKKIKSLNSFGVGSTQPSVEIQAMKELGYENGFSVFCPKETVHYIALFAQATRPQGWSNEDSFDIAPGSSLSLFEYMDKLADIVNGRGKTIDFLTTPDTLNAIIEPALTKKYDMYADKKMDKFLKISDINAVIDNAEKINGWKKAGTARMRAKSLLTTEIEKEVFGSSATTFSSVVSMEEKKKKLDNDPDFEEFIRKKVNNLKIATDKSKKYYAKKLREYYTEILVG